MSAMKQITRRMRVSGLPLGVVALVPSGSSARRRRRARSSESFIATQGRGEVRVRPDSLRVDLGVEAQSPTLEEARSEVARRLTSAMEALNRLKIQELTLQTQTVQFYPVREPQTGSELPRIIGYRAVNSIAATVVGASPEALGELASRIVDAGLNAGIDNVSGIRFFARDVRGAQDRALAAAVKDAEQSARAMAEASGVTLERVVSIEGSPSFQGEMFARAFDAAAAATPVATGEIVVASTVSARFAFAEP